MKNLLILDGNSIINRAFYGIRPLSTKSGIPTNAVYGFINILKKHIDAVNPDYLVCAFDTSAPTFRHNMYADYKGNRKGMPDELAVQLPYAKRAASAMGFKNIECPGFEADDIIGTTANIAEKTGDIHSYILTGDRDSLQLITDNTSVILMKTKEDILFDKQKFTDEYGISPDMFVDVKALMGDSSDNIPGVSGIGEKTALKLISAAHDLDTLYASDDFFASSPSVCKKLADGREMAYKSRELAKICCSAPPVEEILASGFESIKAEPDFASLSELFDELEFTGFAKKFGIDQKSQYESSALSEGKAEASKANYTVKAIGTDIDTDNILTKLNGKEVSLFINDDNFSIYSPDDNADNIVYSGKVAVNADLLKSVLSCCRIICYDLKNLIHLINTEDINCVFDIMLGAYLIDPGKNVYALDKIIDEYASDTQNSTGEEADTPSAENIGNICAALYAVYKKMNDVLISEGMVSLLHEIEIPLAKVLADMESIGFKIDCGGIEEYTKLLTDAENSLADAVWMYAGRQFNINSPKQLGEVLFEEIGLPSGKKTKTGYSTDAETLEALRPYHPIISDILMYRQIAKLRGTYGEPLVKLADKNSRIHTKLNQTGTATGRLSSADPNLQNIPVRMELGRELRKYFIPEDENHVLIDADYSQIELRLLAELSGDEVMREAFIAGEDFHTMVASQVFNVDIDDVTPELRRRAKAVNFGIVYGIGEFSLSKDLGITRKQAAQYIHNYLSTYSKVDVYLKDTIKNAKEYGYTSTMFGRRRNIPELSAKNRNLAAFGERVAMNSPIQGSAADIIKIAMINTHKKLRESGLDAKLIMQVHDELIVEASVDCAEEAMEILKSEMENAAQLNVPLTVDVSMGRSWYEAK